MEDEYCEFGYNIDYEIEIYPSLVNDAIETEFRRLAKIKLGDAYDEMCCTIYDGQVMLSFNYESYRALFNNYLMDLGWGKILRNPRLSRDSALVQEVNQHTQSAA
jgi:hypothetical protein